MTIQYGDYAQWQRETLGGESIGRLLDYWVDKLANAEKVLELPSRHPRPLVQSYSGATLTFTIPAPLHKKIEVFNQREGVTLYMTLLAAFNTLLYRYTGQESIVVGTPIANRNRVELEDLIGLLMNTLALNTNLSGALTVRELLEQVKETTLGAYSHQDLPFEKLVERLHPERDLSRHPLFQVMLVLQNAPVPDIKLPGLTMKIEELDSGTSKFDLTVRLTETAEGIMGALGV